MRERFAVPLCFLKLDQFTHALSEGDLAAVLYEMGCGFVDECVYVLREDNSWLPQWGETVEPVRIEDALRSGKTVLYPLSGVGLSAADMVPCLDGESRPV